MEFNIKLCEFKISYLHLCMMFFGFIILTRLISIYLAKNNVGYLQLKKFMSNRNVKFIINCIFIIKCFNIIFSINYIIHKLFIPFYGWRARVFYNCSNFRYRMYIEYLYTFFWYIGELFNIFKMPFEHVIYSLYDVTNNSFFSKSRILIFSVFLLFLWVWFLNISVLRVLIMLWIFWFYVIVNVIIDNFEENYGELLESKNQRLRDWLKWPCASGLQYSDNYSISIEIKQDYFKNLYFRKFFLNYILNDSIFLNKLHMYYSTTYWWYDIEGEKIDNFGLFEDMCEINDAFYFFGKNYLIYEIYHDKFLEYSRWKNVMPFYALTIKELHEFLQWYPEVAYSHWDYQLKNNDFILSWVKQRRTWDITEYNYGVMYSIIIILCHVLLLFLVMVCEYFF